jgi:hypothetical protein
MEEIPVPQTQPQTTSAPMQICPQCHLSMPLEFYFCSNCGARLRVPPLSTTVMSQALLYLFSAVLPWIAYLAVTKWEGIKYIRSNDSRSRAIGYIALIILVVSSVAMIWYGIIWLQQLTNSLLGGVGAGSSSDFTSF